MKEEFLAGRLKENDAKALEKVFGEFSGYVRTVLRNFSQGTLSREDIDELTVDVFYKLWNSRDKIDPKLGLRPYLSVIAKNAAKNRFRQTPAPNENIEDMNIPFDFRIEDKAELDEMMSCLDEGLKRLSEDEREIFFRYYFYGERLSEISKAAGITENAAHTKLSRTRNKLRELLNERGFYSAERML